MGHRRRDRWTRMGRDSDVAPAGAPCGAGPSGNRGGRGTASLIELPSPWSLSVVIAGRGWRW